MRAMRRSVQIGLVLVLAAGAVVGAAPARAEPVCVDTSQFIAEGRNEVCLDIVDGHAHVMLQPWLWLVSDPISSLYLALNTDGSYNGTELRLSNGSRVEVVLGTDDTGQRYVTVCVEIVVRNQPVGDCITRSVP